jgi:hypothetical protein
MDATRDEIYYVGARSLAKPPATNVLRCERCNTVNKACLWTEWLVRMACRYIRTRCSGGECKVAPYVKGNHGAVLTYRGDEINRRVSFTSRTKHKTKDVFNT